MGSSFCLLAVCFMQHLCKLLVYYADKYEKALSLVGSAFSYLMVGYNYYGIWVKIIVTTKGCISID